MERILTESPQESQWQLLLRYAYPANIKRYHQARGISPRSKNLEDYVSGCLRQSYAYFQSARVATLDISPLLLYYGATNLLAGATALTSGEIPSIRHHGMTQSPGAPLKRIGDCLIRTRGSPDGALAHVCKAFNEGEVLPGGQDWPLPEVLASIPDLKRELLLAYAAQPSFVLEIEVVNAVDTTFDRISRAEVDTLKQKAFDFGRIRNFDLAYLTPQVTNDYFVLYRRRNGAGLAEKGLGGAHFLAIAHEKGGKELPLGTVPAIFMALFGVGMLTRYEPAFWNPFVQSDTTGERHVIEQLVNVAGRMLPNLVLNKIEGKEIHFVFSSGDSADSVAPLTKAQVEDIAKQALDTEVRKRGLRL